MMSVKTKCALLVLMLISVRSFAQLFEPSGVTGDNPSSIRWKYYNARAVKVIFPEGNEKEAARIANIIDYISDKGGISVGDSRKHLDLVLQTNQVISNGYVGLAPYRSEFFATGMQNFNLLGSQNWIEGLAFHEYRHALQFINGRRGLTNVLYIFGGQQLWAVAQAISIPNWYYEGDAVQTETLFSGSGRGRTPFFFQEQRALLLNNRNYAYMKARNGSFRSLLPDHYQLGYAIAQQVRNEKGPEVWSYILRDAGAYKSMFYPFSKAMKHHTGYTSRKTYYRTYDTLRTTWENELKTIELIPTTPVTEQPRRTVTDYEWPHFLADGSIICRKGSFKKTPEMVRIRNGKEESLTTFGFTVTESYLGVNDNIATWTELTTDPRWMNRNYSDIHLMNVLTGEKKKVTTRSKLFSPQYCAIKNQIVAVKADEALKNSIVLIHPETGVEMDKIPNPDNDFLSYPKWTRDGASIVYLAKKGHRIVMLRYVLESKSVIELTPLSQQVIEGMSIGNDRVYFTASYSGINNVYSVNLNGDREVKQITSVKVGANNPAISPDEKTLVMIEQGYMGNALYTQPVDMAVAKTVAVVEPETQERYKIKTTPEESKLYDRIPDRAFQSHDYNGVIRDPKLHSWSFYGGRAGYGVGLYINNILNDFGAQFVFSRNLNEGTSTLNSRIDYAKYYLPFNLNGSINERETSTPTNLTDQGKSGKNTLKFTEAIYGAGISLPLTWYRGIYVTSLRMYANGAMINTSDYHFNNTQINTSANLSIIEGGASLLNFRGRARQNLIPRFGQSLTTYYGRNISGQPANKFQTEAAVYLPGLMRNHGLLFEAGYKKEDLSNGYRFLDNFKHARGYTPMQGDNETVLSANYVLPLLYPDWGFGGIAYFKRIRATLFADFSKVKRETMNKTFNQNSMGAELLFDVVYGNILPISLGLRYASLMNTNYYDNTQIANIGLFIAGTF